MSIERWGWYSIAVNVVLGTLHALIAVASGSLAVAAELVHNVVDLLAAVAVLIGLKLAARKTTVFPYGMYKVENLVAAVLAGMIFLTAYEIAREALLTPSAPVKVDTWMLVLLLATAAIPLLFSHFELRAGLAHNSPALIADAREYRVHIFTTGLAFAALVSQWLHFPLDRIAALLIVVAVAKTGWDLLRDAMRVLLDASLEEETLLGIRRIISADPAVTEIKWVTGRNAGRYRFVEAGVALRVTTPDRTEAAVRRIESSVRAAITHVERVLVHVEAPAATHVRYAVPLADLAGTLSEHFGEAPFFALATVRCADRSIEERRLIGNPFRALGKAKGIRVAEWLVAQKVDVVLMKEDLHSKGPDYVLRDAGVTQQLTDKPNLDEALASA